MPDDNTTIITVVGILGLVAVVGLLLFAMRGQPSTTGSIAVLDDSGNLLYSITDQNRRVVGTVPFQPAGS